MPIDWDAAVIGPLQDVFGEPATYLPSAGPPFPITIVFDKAYQKETILGDGSVGVTTEAPTAGVQLSQFPAAPTQGGRISIASVGTTYQVREVRLDGHGGARLLLNKVSSP